MKIIKTKIASCWRSIAENIELFIILFFIILNIFDLLEYLSPTFDYIDKISGIIALSYIIYLASLSKIILGKRNKKIDVALVISFVLLMFNKVTTAASTSYYALQEKATEIIEISRATVHATPEFIASVGNINALTSGDFTNSFYHTVLNTFSFSHNKIYFAVSDGIDTQLLVASTPSFSITNISNYIDGSLWYLFRFIVENQVLIEKIAFYLGGILLIAIAIYAAYSVKISRSSFLHVLHGDAKRLSSKPLRLVVLFFIFCFFFLFIFQLMVEWLGVVIDAPILFLGILFYIVVMLKCRHLFGAEHLITRIGETGEAFYQKFVKLFHTPYGVALGLSGILVLHLLTDFGIFIVSYTVYQHEALYFEQGARFFAQNHTPLFSILDIFTADKISLFFQDISDISFISKATDAYGFIYGLFAVVWIYLFNIIAMIFLFFAPAYIWWIMFSRKKAHENRFILVLSYIALIIYITLPLFHLGRIDVSGVVGTDITTSSIAESVESETDMLLINIFVNPIFVILISGIAGIIIYLLSYNNFLKKEFVYVSFVAALLFFGVYTFYYLTDIVFYYLDVLLQQYLVSDFFVLFFMGVFGVLSVIFYPISFIVFLYELAKHYRIAKGG